MSLMIIPARGGSKRIPRKNLRPFLGQPVLVRTISLARESRVFDRIVVSTDDAEIAEAAEEAGAEVPFIRPAELSNDYATTREVMLHAIQALTASTDQTTIVGCLYPAAVFVEPVHLRQAVDMLDATSDLPMVLTVGEYPSEVLRALVEQNGRLQVALPKFRNMRTQDLPATFYDAGQFYVGRIGHWTNMAVPLASGAAAIRISDAIDIDTERDWVAAEEKLGGMTGSVQKAR